VLEIIEKDVKKVSQNVVGTVLLVVKELSESLSLVSGCVLRGRESPTNTTHCQQVGEDC
jgi:hypothetical protein